MPVVHADDPGPLRASLIFRVGKTDEYLFANGITHLAEHLALHALGQPPHYQNGAVRTCVTSFDTAGEADQVVGFVREVCRSLHDIPGERLEAERRVVEVEAAQRRHGTSENLLRWRYGASGPGLWGFAEYAIHGATAEEIQKWASYVFTRGNAVLVLSGPPPPGLAVPLPEGPRLHVPPLPAVLPGFPAQFQNGIGEIGGLAPVHRSYAAVASAWLLERRIVERLRFDLGVAYSPQVLYDPYDDDTAQLTLLVDVHPDYLATGCTSVLETIHDLAQDGPSAEELEAYRTIARQASIDAPHVAVAHREALNYLFSGVRDSARNDPLGFEQLTSDDLRRAAVELRDTMLYAVPQGPVIPTESAEMAPTWSVEPPVEGTVVASISPTSPGYEVTRSTMGLTQRWPGQHQATVRYATCRATLAWPDGLRVLIAPDATSVSIEPNLWRDGRGLVAEIDRETAGVVVVMPPRDPAEIPSTPASADDLNTERRRDNWWRAAGGVALLLITALLLSIGLAATTKSADRGGYLWVSAVTGLLGLSLLRDIWRHRR